MLYNFTLTDTGLQCPLSVPRLIPLQSKGRKFSELPPCKRQLGLKYLFSVRLIVGHQPSLSASAKGQEEMSVSDNFMIWRRIKEGAGHFYKHITQTNDLPDLLCPRPSVVEMFKETSHRLLFVRVGDAQNFSSLCDNPKIRWETGKCSWLHFENAFMAVGKGRKQTTNIQQRAWVTSHCLTHI